MTLIVFFALKSTININKTLQKEDLQMNVGGMKSSFRNSHLSKSNKTTCLCFASSKPLGYSESEDHTKLDCPHPISQMT